MSLIVEAYYSDDACSTVPMYVYVDPDGACASSSGSTSTSGSTGTPACVNIDIVYYTTTCVEDKRKVVLDLFGSSQIFGYEAYADANCTELQYAKAYRADGSCLVEGYNYSVITDVYASGSARMSIYNESNDCSTNEGRYNVDAALIADYTCYATGSVANIFYTLNSLTALLDDGSGAGLGTGAIVGIVVGCVAALLIATGLICCYCRRKRRYRELSHQEALLEENRNKDDGSTMPTASTSKPSNIGIEAHNTLWDDDVIISWRVPREKVVSEWLISRGGFGEVYKGTYNSQDVAIKMLLPDKRRSHKHVNAFLDEAKMMAALEHSRIVQFIGVAWDSFNDLCVLSEYMAGGDLRALLLHFEETGQPHGFDHDKVKIALHIAHALTYLHSLPQPVIHRDLKSKNVLLTPELDAKLTDFGVSREREDRTMTAGVGTSLWMAPEVMMGDKYGTPADMFSFGVLLSEIDVQSSPYAHATDTSNSGRKMPDAAILQMVAMGTLRVEFSESSLPEVVELGVSCVSVDPKERPTAAEALYRLQKLLPGL